MLWLVLSTLRLCQILQQTLGDIGNLQDCGAKGSLVRFGRLFGDRLFCPRIEAMPLRYQVCRRSSRPGATPQSSTAVS
jgi:hypothetical protein